MFDCFLHQSFRFGVECRCGFVEDEDWRIFQQGAGYAYSLSLTAREFAAAIANISLEAIFGFHNEVVGVGYFGGAFYIFPDITSTGLTSEQFAESLLKEERVAMVPGNAFGSRGEGFVRCSYAASLKNIEEAMNRMERFVSKRK